MNTFIGRVNEGGHFVSLFASTTRIDPNSSSEFNAVSGNVLHCEPGRQAHSATTPPSQMLVAVAGACVVGYIVAWPERPAGH
jgi:hypothetical protein